MTPEQLKASILQIAIQGKLVEQRAEEGTAEELYQQIQKEKQKLIKEGKIKKEKPLEDIKEDEIPFDIPESWKWCYIGELFLHNTGKAQNASGSQNGVIRKFITTSNLYWNSFDFTKVKEMPFTVQELERCTVKKGDLLVCEGGDCGRSAVWNYDEEVCIQNHVHRLRPYKKLDIYYFYYIFYLYKNTGRLRGRGVAIQGLSNEAIHRVLIPLPPLKEQHRIVAKVEELLPYVDRYAEAYEKLEKFNAKFPEDMKRSILQSAITGKLVEQRAEEGSAKELLQTIEKAYNTAIKEGRLKKIKPFDAIKEDEYPCDIPETWKWVYVNDIAFVTKLAGFEYTKYMANAITSTGEVPIVRAKNVKPNNFMENEEEFISLELSEQLQRCALDTQCILMTFIGAGIGEVAVFENLRRNHLAPNVAKIVPHIDMNKYMMYYFMSPIGQQEIFKFMKAVAQPSLSMDTIRQVKIPLPPLEEQQRIVDKLEDLLPYCDRLVK